VKPRPGNTARNVTTVCPACGRPLSLWDVVKAPTPGSLRCGGCRTALAFDANLPAIALAAVVALSLLAWLAEPLYAGFAGFGIWPAATVAAIAALGVWLLFETALAAYLLRRRTVRARDD